MLNWMFSNIQFSSDHYRLELALSTGCSSLAVDPSTGLCWIRHPPTVADHHETPAVTGGLHIAGYLTEDPKNEAFTDWCGGHLIAAYYSFIYPGRIKCWAGLVGWLTADSLPAWVVTHQLHDASIHPSIHAGRAQDSESSPVKDFERPTFYHCATQPTYKLGIDDRGYSYMVSPYTVTDMTCKCHTSRIRSCVLCCWVSSIKHTHERTWSVKCWARSVCDG